MEDNKKLKEIFVDNFDDEDEKELPSWLNIDDEDNLDSSILDDFNPIGVIGEDPLKSLKKQKIKDILVERKEPLVETPQATKPSTNVTPTTPTPPVAKPATPTPSATQQPALENYDETPTILFDEKEDAIEEQEPLEDIDFERVQSLLESALYVCGNEGASINDLKRLTNLPAHEIKKIMKEWMAALDSDSNRGITIKLYGEKYKFFSKADNREDLSKLITIKYRNPLSNKVMETLAIIAYNQPCTKIIIQNIRGKDPTVSIQKLIDLGLVIEAGRGDGPGRPLLYTVTHKFYDIFGIKNLNELPTINLDEPFHDGDISFFDTNRFND